MKIVLRACLLLMATAVTAAAAGDPPPSQATSPQRLRSGDSLTLVGGTLVERMQHHGHLEALLQCAAPQLQLRVRNIGWSGDDVHGTARAGFDEPPAGYERLLRDLEAADPSVALVAYGFAEASSGLPTGRHPDDAAVGDAAVGDPFEAGLQRLVADLKGREIRVLLLPPFPLPGVKTAGYEQAMQRCRQAVDRVAAEHDVPVLQAALAAADAALFTADGMNPSAAGYEALARQLAPALVGAIPAACSAERLAALRQKIAAKNQLFFHRYRPQNETYLFLFRKHEQGNNAVEIPQFDPLVEQADAAIWQLAEAP